MTTLSSNQIGSFLDDHGPDQVRSFLKEYTPGPTPSKTPPSSDQHNLDELVFYDGDTALRLDEGDYLGCVYRARSHDDPVTVRRRDYFRTESGQYFLVESKQRVCPFTPTHAWHYVHGPKQRGMGILMYGFFPLALIGILFAVLQQNKREANLIGSTEDLLRHFDGEFPGAIVGRMTNMSDRIILLHDQVAAFYSKEHDFFYASLPNQVRGFVSARAMLEAAQKSVDDEGVQALLDALDEGGYLTTP